jgi:hypothetical protein
MALMEKSKLMAFAKKQATAPLAAQKLMQKRALAKPPPPPPAAAPSSGPMKPALAMKKTLAGAPPGHAEPHDEAPHDGEEQEMYIHELVEEAATEAEAGKDQELEDAVAGYTSKSGEDIPKWAHDPALWKEAADAVGLGVPGTEDKYDEPFVVAAYLYRKLGGPVEGLEPAAAEAPAPEGPADMSKPGAAAKAIHARAQALSPTEAKPAAPPPKPATPPPHAAAKPPEAKPAVPPPAPHPQAQAPASAPEAAPADDLTKMVAEAATEAATSPDPALVEKLKAETPMEGAPPSWAVDQEKWTTAEQAVKPQWADYADPWIVVATIYTKMGGAIQ